MFITLGVFAKQIHGNLPIRLGDITEWVKLLSWPDDGAHMYKMVRNYSLVTLLCFLSESGNFVLIMKLGKSARGHQNH